MSKLSEWPNQTILSWWHCLQKKFRYFIIMKKQFQSRLDATKWEYGTWMTLFNRKQIFSPRLPLSFYGIGQGLTTSGVTGGGGGAAGGSVTPRDFRQGKFCWPTGKKEARKKCKRGKMKKKICKIVKGKVENWKWRIEKFKNEGRTFFFSLFKTTKICFGSTKMEIFYREKSISRRKKK